MNLKEQFVAAWEREFTTTLKVLKAFPADKGDFKPHDRSQSAKALAWNFAQAQVPLAKRWTELSRYPRSFLPCRQNGETS